MQLDPNWLAAFIAAPGLAAALGLLFYGWGSRRSVTWQFSLAIVGLLINLGAAISVLATTMDGTRLVLQMGQYQAPFGITIIADAMSAVMLFFTALLGLTTVIYARGTLDDRDHLNFFPLLLLLIMGVNGAFLAGDIFNLYVFFEVLLVGSFALLTLGGQIGQINGGIRYVLLNMLASVFFLAAAGLIYGTVGTLNMAQIAERMPQTPVSVQLLIAGLLFIAYATKAGLFPLFFWLPASYHTAHPAVTSLFGGLLTKLGVYTLFRIYTLIFPELLQEWQGFVFLIAGLTMVTGIFGAMAVNTMRRVLSFHIISQVGYMIMGLGLAATGNPVLATFGLAAGILYVVHQMLIKTAVLMAGGAAELVAGSGSLLRIRMAGLRQRSPVLAVIFFIAAMSLAGLPPSSGFVSKLSLLQSAIDAGHWAIAGVSLIVSFFTLMSMLRIWQKAFWGYPAPETSAPSRIASPMRTWLTLSPIAVLLAFSLWIGIFSAPALQWFDTAAAQALDRAAYIEAVAPTDIIEYLGGSYEGK